MKSDKLLKYKVSRATNSNDFNNGQEVSHPILNHQFYDFLKDSIKMNKDCPSIKGRILMAKRILTPIIQDLMTDVLEQLDQGKLTGVKTTDGIEKKDVQVLYNNLKVNDLWCLDDTKEDMTDNGEWAMKILREISEDLEQPFKMLNEKVKQHQPPVTNKEVVLNESLLVKLTAIHEHLGSIIKRLKEKCSVNPDETSSPKKMGCFDFQKQVHNLAETVDKKDFLKIKHAVPDRRPDDSKSHPTYWKEFNASNVNSRRERDKFMYSNQEIDVYDELRTRKSRSTSSLSEHDLFEEKRNRLGNREIIIKCLQDLEKVRRYLEALRNNEIRENSEFPGLESCKNENCNESQPHLHANPRGTPMVLKLNKHADVNELDNDLIIGFPSSTKQFPDVHILLNRNRTNPNSRSFERTTTKPPIQQKRVLKESRIPKPINKKRINANARKKGEPLDVLSQNNNPQKDKTLNLVIFDPDDPSKSIIKMKELKTPRTTDSTQTVSKLITTPVGKTFNNVRNSNCWNKSKKNPFWHRNNVLETKIDRSKVVAPHTQSVEEFFRKKTSGSGVDFQNFPSGHQESYMKSIFEFISFMKGDYGRIARDLKLTSKTNYPKKITNILLQLTRAVWDPLTRLSPADGNVQIVHFFECFWDKKDKPILDSSVRRKWSSQSKNSAVYPIWTIRKSKYYSVPRLKRKHKSSSERITPAKPEDKLRHQNKPSKGLQPRQSEVEVCSRVSSECEKLKKVVSDVRGDMKRKVSFKDQVDVSGPAVNYKKDLDYEGTIEANYNENNWDDVDNPSEQSSSSDLDDLEEFAAKIPQLLMTESFMRLPDRREVNIQPPINLQFTDSARKILEKISESFDVGRKENLEVLQTADGRLISQFYDINGETLGEVFNQDGAVIGRAKSNDVSLALSLFDSDGCFIKNRYTTNGNRIRAVYDANQNVIKRILWPKPKCMMENNLDKTESLQYYDSTGRLIDHIYDEFGYEVKAPGKNLTSLIFKDDGGVNVDVYSKNGRKINTVYDSKGQVLGETSDKINVRKGAQSISDIDNGGSLSVLLEAEEEIVDLEEENSRKAADGCSRKILFDENGNPLRGVYDKMGKPIKVTSSSQHEKLLPYLFDDKGKFQRKRYNSKGTEIKSVFDEHGRILREVSIPWLNELLATISHKSITKKMDSISKKKCKLKTNGSNTLDHFYDVDGNFITRVYDSKGNLTAATESGEVSKLLLPLFDNNGNFIRGRYDYKRRVIRSVYDRNGNPIKSISSTEMNELLKKSTGAKKDVIPKTLEKLDTDICSDTKTELKPHRSRSLSVITQEKLVSLPVLSKSSIDQSVRKEDSLIQLFDKEGKLITSVYNSKGNLLEISDSGDILKLWPYLFDSKGKFMKKRFDASGNKLKAAYDKNGNVINKMVISKNEVKTKNSAHKTLNSEVIDKFNKNIILLSENEDISNVALGNKYTERRAPRLNTYSVTPPGSNIIVQSPTRLIVDNPIQSAVGDQTRRNENPEYKQLKPTSSVDVNLSTNEKPAICSSLKAGGSIYKFYDERGNIITEVYDSKGRVLRRSALGEVDKLAPYMFDENGALCNELHDQYGRKLKRIYDQEGRSISRISVTAIFPDNLNKGDQKLPGSVYDESGRLVQEIYDENGHLIAVTKSAKLVDLAHVIFDEMGVRRKVYNKEGYEFGHLYDHEGNLLRYQSVLSKAKSENERSRICSKEGKYLRNFYDSDGALIVAIYNDYGKELCTVNKEDNNVEVLSKFFFDRHGHFLRGRFFDQRGARIKHVYDSDDNIIRSIRRTRSRKIAHLRSTDSGRKETRTYKSFPGATTRKVKSRTSSSRYRSRRYYAKNEARAGDSIRKNPSSHCDVMPNRRRFLMKRSISACSMRKTGDELVILSASSSMPSMTAVPMGRLYDEQGRLVTGVYNSKSRLLGYSASGNARVLAPYLFDNRGNFVYGRFNTDGKQLKSIFDSRGKLMSRISKQAVKKKNVSKHRNKTKTFDALSNPNAEGKKVCSTNENRCRDLIDLLDAKGNFLRKKYNVKERNVNALCNNNRKVKRKISPLVIYSTSENLDSKHKEDRKHFSLLSNFRDKILTVIFDNHNRITHKLSTDTIPKKTDKVLKNIYVPVKGMERGCSLNQVSIIPYRGIYDENGELIRDIYDADGNKITKLFNSNGSLVCNLYTSSGNLIKNDVLNGMFEKDGMFSPKARDRAGNVISRIYANKKLVKRVFDENRNPAKVDSDLVYLVSKRSLPDTSCMSLPATHNQVHYFSEGSAFPFPEGHRKTQQHVLNQGSDHCEDDQLVALTGCLSQAADYICDLPNNVGSNERFVQFGEGFLRTLSKYTIPFDKILPGTFYGPNLVDHAEQADFDSLEALVDKFVEEKKMYGLRRPRKEDFCTSSRILLDDDVNLPISKKVIEKTLMTCVHLSNSTDVLGNISKTVLEHFTTLILQEIQQKFYQKLEKLQWDSEVYANSSIVGIEKDVCIGTELKFEDSLIGKHSLVQTSSSHTFTQNRAQMCPCCKHYQHQAMTAVNWSDFSHEEYIPMECAIHKTLVCKIPNIKPFMIMMKKKKTSDPTPSKTVHDTYQMTLKIYTPFNFELTSNRKNSKLEDDRISEIEE